MLLAGTAWAASGSSQLHRGGWDARLHRFRGDVHLRLAGKKSWVRPKTGAPLYSGDVIRVGRKSFAELSFGSSAVVHLRPGTLFEFVDLNPEKTRVRLKYGTMLQKLKSVLGLSKKFRRKIKWEVETPYAVAAVRGTEFGVTVSSTTGATTAGVFDEGKVFLTPLGGDAQGLLLTRGDEADVLETGVVGRKRSLREFKGYRARMRRLRKTLAAISRRYRTLPIRKRRRLREKLKKKYNRLR